MAYAAKLMNPTPWDVKINYEKGIVITIPAFGQVDLTMGQFEDYRPNTPGAEAVYEILDTEGVFLFDTDRPYENQALDTLKRTLKKREDLVNTKEKHYTDLTARQNLNYSPEQMENVFRQLGTVQLREKCEAIKRFIEKYEAVVKKETSRRRTVLDPDRTVFSTNPPREFPSKVAREFFLSENPTIAAKEAELRAGMAKAEAEANESTDN
jgi:hypothetical protein